MPAEIDQKALLQSLYNYGHFWNPGLPDTLNVDASNVGKLTLSDRVAKEALGSWQSFDANFDAISFLMNLRAIIDGEFQDVGPVTAAMASAKRCAIPDYAPPPNASFHYDDPGLQSAVESYQRYAESGYLGGSGSWPRGCDPLNPTVHSVVVAIDTSNASQHQKFIINDVLRMVEITEAEIGQSVRHVFDGSVQNPQHSVKFENISGSTIGYAYFPDPDNCNQTVRARIDNTFNANKYVLAELLTHEYKGHSDGLQHTRGGIMNPSIGSPSAQSTWRGDPSERVKVRYFGGIAIPSGTTTTMPPGTIPPIPPIGDYNGVFTFQGKIFKIKVFE